MLGSAQPANTPLLPPPELPPVIENGAADLRNATYTRNRTFVFNDGPNSTFTINNQTFDLSRTDVFVTVGDIEFWTLQNPSLEFHVFHSHQLGFQVVSINGEPQPLRGYQETVNLPFYDNATGLPGEVEIVMPFTDSLLVGRFPFHCHIMQHEDGGMMALIQVSRPGARSAASRELAGMLIIYVILFLCIVAG